VLFSYTKALGKEAVKTGKNTLSAIDQRKPDQQVCTVIKRDFGKYKLEQEAQGRTGPDLGLKGKCEIKMLQ
jgi:hypothetical protein